MAQEAIRTILPDGGITLSNIIDKFTGESIQLVKLPSLPSGVTADGIIYFQTDTATWGVEYWARAEYLTTGVIQLKWFGAKGDGITDNAAAFNSALAIIPEQGGVIEIGEGVFNVDSKITIPTSGNRTIPVTVRGLDSSNHSNSTSGTNRGRTKIIFTGDGILFDLGGGDTSGEIESYCSFENMSINKAGGAEEGDVAISSYQFRGTLSNVLIGGFHTGLYIDYQLYYSRLENLSFRSNVIGMDLALVNGSAIEKCRFENQSDCGILFRGGGRNCSVYSSWFENNNVGIRTIATRQVSLFDCYFEANILTSIIFDRVDSDVESGIKSILNLFGGSISINSPATSAMRVAFTGGGCIVNIHGTTFANRSPEATVVVDFTGGAVTTLPEVLVTGIAWYAVDSGLSPLPIRSGNRDSALEIKNQQLIFGTKTLLFGANQPPSVGTYSLGSICFRNNNGRNIGWRCTAAGTPGSWTPFGYVDVDLDKVKSGATGNRPTVTTIGYTFFDTTLGKPIYWDGTNWVDSTGATV